ncbi:conserved hypothetical protein [Tenacibaculum dicentrarchi]|uniref:Tetratrico peptide repeat group 5 domain-containing protein n=1 Tax=Tenacibaculum dicentrarchi TaxID=669041 RepID=A0ABM9NWA7_9FLAO|nr:conserved hypothetical protein [Tenacibaculum dicentrarchi]SOS51812.1 conserved hypothetical protein [Tenacibaculum dicentrarchi]
MTEKLKKAIKLRTENKYIKAEKIFCELIFEYPKSGEVFYHYAWLCDNMQRELEAYPKYEKALELGLKDIDLEGCYLGLGSTYRCIGEYTKSVNLLQKAIFDFPENREFKVFKAMSLFNLNKCDEAMNILLNIIAETSNDNGIKKYKNAIKYYSDKLNKKFD